MGIFPALSVAIVDSSLSTQTTSCPFSARQAPTTSPTYPVPTTAIFILYLSLDRAPCRRLARRGARVLQNGTSHGRDGGRISQQHADHERLRPARAVLCCCVPDRMVTCQRARPDRLSVRAARPQRRWRVRSSARRGLACEVSTGCVAPRARPDDLLELVERPPDSFERARRRQDCGPSRARVGAQPGLASARLAPRRAAGRRRGRRPAFPPSPAPARPRRRASGHHSRPELSRPPAGPPRPNPPR